MTIVTKGTRSIIIHVWGYLRSDQSKVNVGGGGGDRKVIAETVWTKTFVFFSFLFGFFASLESSPSK